MDKLRVLGKNIHFDLGEQEIMKCLMNESICTEAEAIDHVIRYKREQAIYHERKGNYALAEHLLKSIDEWDNTRAAAHKAGAELIEETKQKLILPG